MAEWMTRQQHELAAMAARYAAMDGVYPTAIPSLYFIRDSNTSVSRYGVYKPSLCLVVQGAKEVWLAQERYRYSPADYLVASVHLPVTARVAEASSDAPYLGLRLEFSTDQILEVLRESGIRTGAKEPAARGLFVSRMEQPLLDAVIRLVRLLDNPHDIPLLAPLFTKEIMYRVLRGEHGAQLEQMAIEGSSAHYIQEVIEYIVRHYDQPLRIGELAEQANMSVSSFHRHFREVTAMSPLQFQKQLRLQEARRLLLTGSANAADAAFRVGYASPSQFSREYARMFGYPPAQDIRRFMERKTD